MSTLVVEYDPWRGGCCLYLGAPGMPTDKREYILPETRQVGLRHMDTLEPFQGTFPVTPGRCRVGPILVRQDDDTLAIWFSTDEVVPCSQWSTEERARAFLFYSTPGPFGHQSHVRILAGIRYRWWHQARAGDPITELVLDPQDFK